MNVRYQFHKIMWVTLIFYFTLFISGIIAITSNGLAAKSIVGAAAIFCLAMSIWLMILLQKFEPEEEFYQSLDELRELKQQYKEATEDYEDAIRIIGGHEAMKMIKATETQ